jgi:hypothetical protein
MLQLANASGKSLGAVHKGRLLNVTGNKRPFMSTTVRRVIMRFRRLSERLLDA